MAVITSGTVGVDAAGNMFVYTPPVVTALALGSMVSYGPWVTIQDGDSLPAAPTIVEVEDGSAPLQAANQVVYRTVTLVPV